MTWGLHQIKALDLFSCALVEERKVRVCYHLCMGNSIPLLNITSSKWLHCTYSCHSNHPNIVYQVWSLINFLSWPWKHKSMIPLIKRSLTITLGRLIFEMPITTFNVWISQSFSVLKAIRVKHKNLRQFFFSEGLGMLRNHNPCLRPLISLFCECMCGFEVVPCPSQSLSWSC